MPLQCRQANYEAIEAFAGQGVVHRVLKKVGLKSRAIDVLYWEHAARDRSHKKKKLGKHNPCDILQPAGFLLLVCMHGVIYVMRMCMIG